MRATLELTKPRITLLVVLCSAAGYALARPEPFDAARLAWTLLGVAFASAATGVLNQWLEIDEDAKMRRTASRPLPSGRVPPRRALAFGLACAAAASILAWKVNALAWLLSLATLVVYLAVYTPLKRRTPWATWVGAVPGAMPPLIGWAAAAGRLDAAAWTLFAIQFLWQIPHFLALAWLFREDYARAGFQVASVADPSGRAVAAQLTVSLALLAPAGLLPAAFGLGGPAYAVLAASLGAAFLVLGFGAARGLSETAARRVFLASLAYLPLLFGALVAS